jgi:hypothetical protein
LLQHLQLLQPARVLQGTTKATLLAAHQLLLKLRLQPCRPLQTLHTQLLLTRMVMDTVLLGPRSPTMAASMMLHLCQLLKLRQQQSFLEPQQSRRHLLGLPTPS